MKKKEYKALKELIEKYRQRKIQAMEERKNYETDHGHNCVISLCQDIEIDLRKFALGEKQE